MFAKIKNKLINTDWQNFRDVRILGLLAFGFIALLTTWSGVSIVETNYDLQQQIVNIDRRNQLAELENQNLKLANKYYETDTYLELIAREQFNKGKPGERLVLVPKEVALAKAPDLSSSDQNEPNHTQSKSKYQQNLDAWLEFFFGRDI